MGLMKDPRLLAAVAIVVIAAAVLAAVAYDELAGEPADATGGVPETLPDGSRPPTLPEHISSRFDRPTVGVEVLGEQPRVEGCVDEVEWSGSPRLRSATVTPEGLTIALRGQTRDADPALPLTHLTCHARWQGEAWEVWAVWQGAMPDEEELAGPLASACCLAKDTALSGTEAAAPPGSAWAAQDRGEYWLVYPVHSNGYLHLMWPVGQGEEAQAPRTIYLDEQGERIEEEAQPGPAPEPESEPEPRTEGT